MSALDDHYPVSCPFCRIAEAFPADASSPVPINPDPEKTSPESFVLLSTPHVLAFLDILPIAPGHILLTTRDHYVKLSDLYSPPSTSTSQSQSQTSRSSRDRALDSARALGEFLPIVSRALCRATGIEDWNVVQNNGERAAQVVPHLHFHLIPRYQEGRREIAGRAGRDVGMLKSWKMFGRGAREELDEDEGRALAEVLRESLRVELGEGMREGGKSRL